MNINVEKLKEAKVTIPIAAIIACVVFIWNVSGKYADFQESVATDDEVAAVQEDIDEDISDINRTLSDQDKRILILEVTSGTLGLASAAEGPKPPREEEALAEEEGSE